MVEPGGRDRLPAPGGARRGHGDFAAYLKAQGVTPADVDLLRGRLVQTRLLARSQAQGRQAGALLLVGAATGTITASSRSSRPNRRATPLAPQRRHRGQLLAAARQPERGVLSGKVFQWVTCFREDGLTLPWAEDYAWQVPLGTQQMNGINLDLFRAGLRGKPDRKILYYVMPHSPGNTPASWRRMFHNALGHGMKIVDLFEFRPVQAAYTENHVSNPEMYAMVLKTFRELGQYEDIVQAGQRRPAEAGLWFSETADIWDDNGGSFGAAKRACTSPSCTSRYRWTSSSSRTRGRHARPLQGPLSGRPARQPGGLGQDRRLGAQRRQELLATAGQGCSTSTISRTRCCASCRAWKMHGAGGPRDARVGFGERNLAIRPSRWTRWTGRGRRCPPSGP